MNSNHSTNEADDMRKEYDFANLKGDVRGKYVKAFEGKATTVLLDSNVRRRGDLPRFRISQ